MRGVVYWTEATRRSIVGMLAMVRSITPVSSTRPVISMGLVTIAVITTTLTLVVLGIAAGTQDWV